MNAFKPKANAKILVDSGDPEETVRVKRLVGYVDGQTTNPTVLDRSWMNTRRLCRQFRL